MTPRCPACGQFVSPQRPHDHPPVLKIGEFVEMVRKEMTDVVRKALSEDAPLFDALRRCR